jgi:hypothetical protein
MKNILFKIFNYLNYDKFIKKIFIFFWILCFVPISSRLEDIYNLGSINNIRLIVPLLSVLLLSLLLIKNKNFIKEDFLIYFLFPIYTILLILFTLTNQNIDSYLNLYWGFAMLIPYLYLYIFKNKLKTLRLFLIFSLILTLIVYTFYISSFFYLFIKTHTIQHFYTLGLNHINFLNEFVIHPRSSGLSRMALLLFFACILLLLTQKKKYFVKILIVFIIFLSVTLILFQSRTSTFIFLFLNIILSILLIFSNKLYELRIQISIILCSIFLATFLNYKINLNNQFSNSKNLPSSYMLGEILVKTLKRETMETNYSSGRYEIWYNIIEISKDNIFKGYGFQADRLLIKNESAHNLYLYSLICGGLISFFFIILISLRASWVSFLILYITVLTNKKFDTLILISTFITIIFLLRGFLETSYGIYSLDYLFFIVCFFINEEHYKKLFIGNFNSRK